MTQIIIELEDKNKIKFIKEFLKQSNVSFASKEAEKSIYSDEFETIMQKGLEDIERGKIKTITIDELKKL